MADSFLGAAVLAHFAESATNRRPLLSEDLWQLNLCPHKYHSSYLAQIGSFPKQLD